MPLQLTIISYQRLSPGQDTTKTLNRGKLSIGRASQNDWVLQDPERILSKNHCTVEFRDDGYRLTDLSVNGTFLNDSEERLERHQSIELNDGDHFVLGEYEIAVSLLPEGEGTGNSTPDGPLTDLVLPAPSHEQAAIPSAVPTPAPEQLPVAAPADILKPSFSDIMAESQRGQEQPHLIGSQAGAIVTEPCGDRGGPERASFEPPMLVTEAAPMAAHDQRLQQPAHVAAYPEEASNEEAGNAQEPDSEPLIPDDWWNAPPAPAPAIPAAIPFSPPPASATPVIAPRHEVETPSRQPPPPMVAVKEQVTPPRAPSLPDPTTRPEATPPDGDRLLRAFLEGAGLHTLRLPPDQQPEVMATLGAIFRETVQGLMEVLLARSDVKGEFRLDRTTMGPVENNPLKTPPGRPPLSPEEVMALLLVGWKAAYMPPIEAVHESFNDIKAHQMAVMAGIQAALNRLLARFDPANLETSLGQSMLDNLWPANRKAKYWDLYTAEYQAIAREAEDDFNKLFGGEFARAYEARLRDR